LTPASQPEVIVAQPCTRRNQKSPALAHPCPTTTPRRPRPPSPR